MVTGVGEKQIDGEAMIERGESSRLRPSTAAETAGARRNRPATAEAIRGSRRPRVRVREEGEERVGRTGLDQPNQSGLTWFNPVTRDLIAISKTC